MLEQAARPRLDPDGRQVVDVVVDRGYHPGTIVARAGQPLRLVFRRDDDDVCSERVVFSAPRLDRRLAATGVTTIDLPAQPPGEVRFTCGMGRYRGRIQLIGERAPSIIGRLRDRASRFETASGTGLAPSQDPAAVRERGVAAPVPAWPVSRTAARPRWLLPALLALAVIAGLVAGGFVSLSTVLSVGLFGGMILMHLGGHGAHGGHGRADGPVGPAEFGAGGLRIPSSDAQAGHPSSGDGLDHGARADGSRHEANDDDKDSSDGSH